MRGNLPGNEIKSEKSEKEVKGYDEMDLLLLREFICPACERKFKTCTPKMTRLIKDKDDADLRPRYINLDILKYQVIECPVCGFADLERDFMRVRYDEIKAYKAQGIKPDMTACLNEGVRGYKEAYMRYKSAIRCNMIRGCSKGKRGYTMMLAAWLLRGWREERELLEYTVEDTDPMSEAEEKKLLKYAVKEYEEALMKEDFPIYGITEPTFDYLMAALLYELGDPDTSTRYVIRALQNKELKPVYRIKAEELRDKLRK